MKKHKILNYSINAFFFNSFVFLTPIKRLFRLESKLHYMQIFVQLVYIRVGSHCNNISFWFSGRKLFKHRQNKCIKGWCQLRTTTHSLQALVTTLNGLILSLKKQTITSSCIVSILKLQNKNFYGNLLVEKRFFQEFLEHFENADFDKKNKKNNQS